MTSKYFKSGFKLFELFEIGGFKQKSRLKSKLGYCVLALNSLGPKTRPELVKFSQPTARSCVNKQEERKNLECKKNVTKCQLVIYSLNHLASKGVSSGFNKTPS